ncbi:hypothetical protein A8F94_22160 [Bacillus sp. FJAT-27225]|uniref:hypothetical protein n=1 Tax=Bacillus sp. FJAT-27225 TaxID=1743144 RepID=UPI00080C2D4C|nr:hypothetical protein [Bacillus sp. FJAT-27225]OCA81578.1 hypothetical protein A8F94_22160 [Bacillus sp. FJAT-27225]
MRKLLSVLLVLMFTLTTMGVSVEGAKENTRKPVVTVRVKSSAEQLRLNYRVLWNDHAFWTRDLVKSSVARLEDTGPVLARLLKNQEDLGNAIKPFYGEAAGNTLTNLLKEHINIAVKVVEAAKAGNKDALNKANSEWYRNADQIADLLTKLNPNINKAQFKEMYHIHLKLITDMAVARIHKDWTADIMAADHNSRHLLMLADTITGAIIKQFPAKFK